MKRPATKVMVMGHPIVAVPMTLAGGVTLFAAFHASNLFVGGLAVAMLASVRMASDQASKYRAWKAEWDGMADGPGRRPRALGRVFGMVVIAALILVGFAMRYQLAYAAGYAVGWIGSQLLLLAPLGLVALGVAVQFIRRYPRRAPDAKPVAVVAKPVLQTPSLADAYRALPPYCLALLRGQS